LYIITASTYRFTYLFMMVHWLVFESFNLYKHIFSKTGCDPFEIEYFYEPKQKIRRFRCTLTNKIWKILVLMFRIFATIGGFVYSIHLMAKFSAVSSQEVSVTAILAFVANMAISLGLSCYFLMLHRVKESPPLLNSIVGTHISLNGNDFFLLIYNLYLT